MYRVELCTELFYVCIIHISFPCYLLLCYPYMSWHFQLYFGHVKLVSNPRCACPKLLTVTYNAHTCTKHYVSAVQCQDKNVPKPLMFVHISCSLHEFYMKLSRLHPICTTRFGLLSHKSLPPPARSPVWDPGVNVSSASFFEPVQWLSV